MNYSIRIIVFLDITSLLTLMSVCPSIGWFVRRTVFYKLLKRQSSYRITCFFNDGAMIELNFRIIEQ